MPEQYKSEHDRIIELETQIGQLSDRFALIITSLGVVGIFPDIILNPDATTQLFDPGVPRTDTITKTYSKGQQTCTVTTIINIESKGFNSDTKRFLCITPIYMIVINVREECTNGTSTNREVGNASITHRGAPICNPNANNGATRPVLPSDTPTTTDTSVNNKKSETVKYPHGTTANATSEKSKVTVTITSPDGTTNTIVASDTP
ncbi:hypothetical protein Xen7305DRAFT_00029020 [Xenococcus sp. PCC 7305]|uniref:hypothetical protein n=1 Tax=Xenococcus sp. PCC 7305 TaxID=102125 RepID=UPI0002AD178B|nr:hypothetical protein [Xenococcus sp. PCC 7305]ELS03182.1 hypothetical protein Xen7305DRAFT_00029020 [Xenococcus sp. PCC 7305]